MFKIRLKRETNLMQACSANQHQVIMPSWLPKVPTWLRKNALYLSQSGFSNFALYVINIWNEAGDPNFFCISGTSNSLSDCNKNFKKFYRVENFRANVLKCNSIKLLLKTCTSLKKGKKRRNEITSMVRFILETDHPSRRIIRLV